MHKSLLLSTVLLFPSLVIANDCLPRMQSEIHHWMQSGHADFAPHSSSRAQAYLGAAMMADEQGNAKEALHACEQAEEALHTAQSSYAYLQDHWADLLDLQRTHHLLAPYHRELSLQTQAQVRLLESQGEEQMQSLVSKLEAGALNEVASMSNTLKETYTQAIELTLPPIIERTGKYLASAAASGAKQYAPITYERAKEALIHLEQYRDGLTTVFPEHPAQALVLAQKARELSERVKHWRKDQGSHEKIWLDEQALYVDIASTLGIVSSEHGLASEVSADALRNGVQTLKQQIEDLKTEHASVIARLNAAHNTQLNAQLEQQQQSLLANRSSQMQELKEALHHKFEREKAALNQQAKSLEEKYQRDTFEQRRQKKLRELFHDGEVEILVNIDSSILIRLKALAFAPSSSAIADKQAPFIKRLAEGLNLYETRNLRIEGHTDNHGEIKANQVLSLKRAEAVQRYLLQMGVDAARIKALGYGEVKPIASNEFDKGRAMNRRIDLIIEKL